MSWTLVRHKNGQAVPIKVSVLDVFCSGSKKDGKSNEASHVVRSKANTKATVAPKAQAGTTGATTSNSSSASTPEVWTEEDDKILREMKTNGKGWKPILEALGDKHNSQYQAKARWHEIEGKPVGGVASGGANEEKIIKEEEKNAKYEKAKAEGLAKQAAGKEGKGGKKEKKGVLKNNNAKSTSQEHELKAAAAKYDNDKWLAVASRHFDRTGQRISPEMAREMCGATD